MVKRPGHPLADSQGRVGEHRVALYDAIGPGPHACHWCGTEVDWGQGVARGVLIPDHLDGDKRNNVPDNLVPSCHRCNTKRGRGNLVGDDEPYVTMTGSNGRHRAVKRTCETCGAEFLHLAADKRPNRGRFCSQSCARKHPRTEKTHCKHGHELTEDNVYRPPSRPSARQCLQCRNLRNAQRGPR